MNIDIEDIKKEIDIIFKEIDNIDRANDIVVKRKIMDWNTFHICQQSEKIGILKLLDRLMKIH
jgi:hypothetical protein